MRVIDAPIRAPTPTDWNSTFAAQSQRWSAVLVASIALYCGVAFMVGTNE